LDYIATVTIEKITETYEVKGSTPYQAKIRAALLFIKKYKLPGRPYHLLRNGNISLQSKEDRRIKHEV